VRVEHTSYAIKSNRFFFFCMVGHDSVPQKSLTLCLASRRSSKQAIATIACLFASRRNRKSRRTLKRTKNDSFKLSVEVLNASLEGTISAAFERGGPQPVVADSSLSSPDFLILHSTYSSHTPLELHGFPPWHIRLTEI
jgi:dehydrodolichyl diphosphate syntase complex subunit NUS1